MLSNTSRYAVRAVIYLAVHGQDKRKIGIKKIAEAMDIPAPFLGKILQVLVRRKILASTKGPHGGFGIAKDPFEISPYDIITEMDGDDLFNACILGTGNCNGGKKNGHCAIHSEFEMAKKELVSLYKTKTIGDLAAKAASELDKIIL
ncbi:MAG: Rrf2 family transcriptional regulator [Salinivirgaceae bacterium]|nr:Rrf2 family transcriptional regulator [Salinivirgaceae bacterium]